MSPEQPTLFELPPAPVFKATGERAGERAVFAWYLAGERISAQQAAAAFERRMEAVRAAKGRRR